MKSGWKKLAPHAPISQYRHNDTGEDNADAHMKRQVMGREVVVAVTDGRLDFGTWERIFYGEFDGRRRKRVLVRIIGEQRQSPLALSHLFLSGIIPPGDGGTLRMNQERPSGDPPAAGRLTEAESPAPLTTRLYGPLVIPDLEQCTRPAERLERSRHRPLTLISAPAGSVKTILASI